MNSFFVGENIFRQMLRNVSYENLAQRKKIVFCGLKFAVFLFWTEI